MSQAPQAPISEASTTFVANSWATKLSDAAPSLLSPIDLQAVKAAGVTFVISLLERGDRGAGRGVTRPRPRRCAARSRG